MEPETKMIEVKVEEKWEKLGGFVAELLDEILDLDKDGFEIGELATAGMSAVKGLKGLGGALKEDWPSCVRGLVLPALAKFDK